MKGRLRILGFNFAKPPDGDVATFFECLPNKDWFTLLDENHVESAIATVKHKVMTRLARLAV